MMSRTVPLLIAVASALLAQPADQNEEGPGYCWDHYVMEAVAAFDEWDDCHDNVAWYDIGGFFTCDLVYNARAIGAAMWWAKCVGLPGRDA